MLTDLTVKRQITDSISENLTDSDLESTFQFFKFKYFLRVLIRSCYYLKKYLNTAM